jgi:SAM-dependent methyltransferase
MDDLPRRFVIRESSHRIHNPFTNEKLATLGRALYLSPGTSVLDLACGSGEMLCTWARDHRLTGTGVDVSTAFIGAARARAIELGVADRVTFIHGDAAGYVAERPVGLASCIGATWIGDGVAGTVELLRRSLSPGGKRRSATFRSVDTCTRIRVSSDQVRDLARVCGRCSCESGEPQGRSPVGLPAWLPPAGA